MLQKSRLKEISEKLKGELYYDNTHRIIYSTDASAYKEKPTAVAFPKNSNDIKILIDFARKEKTSLIPRGAGTSLAGQVTGSGIVVDISKYMNKIISIDTDKKQVTIQPGVILSELNKKLEKYNLFFAPETSTANRCTMSGMLGNNACGLHSVAYGSTRDHTISVKTILSDGSEVLFGKLSENEFDEKCKFNNLEGKIYQNIKKILSDSENQKLIEKEYPDKNIPRRNTGYALDLLLESSVFGKSDKKFNFAKLLAGSEGTLAFTTEITLNLLTLPPKNKALIVAHFNSLEKVFPANLIALKHKPTAVELADSTILNLTKENIGLRKNRFFIKGDPAAILIIEFSRETKEEIIKIAEKLEKEMREQGLAYHFPVIWGDDIKKVWDLRRAGLGVLSNMKGDARSVSLVEDTAVNVEKLGDYIKDFNKLLNKHDLNCVFHAHIGTGELHLRPILNLKKKKDVELFRTFAFETAKLVKKYKGSLSGEHGDGRLRGEFIPLMYGEHIYSLFKNVKKTWDKDNIFNPGKITDTPAMNTFLRYVPDAETPQFETIFDFSKTDGILRAAEKCNGSADCRKTEIIGGTLCPSFMASKNENQTTRARANMLREILTNETNPFENTDLYKVLDLCLSCKACKSECPSSVDVAKMKAEFLQHYYDKKGVPFRSRIVANITKINRLLSVFPNIANFFLNNRLFSKLMMRIIGFEPKRKMPLLSKKTLNKQFKIHKRKRKQQSNPNYTKKVYLFADEFTNYNDSDIGIKAIRLLEKLGYEVEIPKTKESGRTYISKGLIRKAKKIAGKNIGYLDKLISTETPLLGIEPSAILSFKDEYIDFFGEKSKFYKPAQKIAKNTFLIDEFLASEIKKGNIKKEQFTDKSLKIKYHGHCQQKAIISTEATNFVLSFPKNYEVEEIPSGCCGMAGSFGFEKEHYELSQKIGELVLFPAVRKADKKTVIVANGTSCRHQIKEGTNRKAVHPVEILWEAISR